MKSLTEWLQWLAQFQLPLDDLSRQAAVDEFHFIKHLASKLGFAQFNCPVITVAGTNGKGSCAAFLEAAFLAGGYRTGLLMSPHLVHFNERLRLEGKPVVDEKICQAFQKIKEATGDRQLSYYRFFNLSLVYLAYIERLDVMVLEVGLGGRFDTINVVDSDVAVITSIALDHCEILGHSREAIAKEKAGIMRPNKPVVCGDENPPATLREIADKSQCHFYQQGVDFQFTENKDDWIWQSKQAKFCDLPLPKILLQNAAAAIMALELFKNLRPVSEANIREALMYINLRGRCELLPGKPAVLLDVSHNVASAARLLNYIDRLRVKGQLRAIFAAMQDKDIAGMLQLATPCIQQWYLPRLAGNARAASTQQLVDMLSVHGKSSQQFGSVEQAYQKALQESEKDDLIVVFGTFAVVAEMIRNMECEANNG